MGFHNSIVLYSCASVGAEPATHFSSPETQEINQQMFASVATKLTSPEERLNDMGEGDPVGLISRTRAISRAGKEQVWGGNAARLLGIH